MYRNTCRDVTNTVVHKLDYISDGVYFGKQMSVLYIYYKLELASINCNDNLKNNNLGSWTDFSVCDFYLSDFV